MKRERNKNGKDVADDYVVAVTVDHFVLIRATSEEVATERGLNTIKRRFGQGQNIRVKSTEKV